MQLQLITIASIIAFCNAQTLNIPTRVGNVEVLTSARPISGSVDFGNREFDRGVTCKKGDTGSANAVFILANGATLSNVIIGANQLEGVHCSGSCTLRNVWFRNVCEDAVSALGTGDVTIQGGGAQGADDKVVQHNGRGTVTIRDYTVVGAGKVYRSCGNCSNNGGPRKVVIEGLRVNGITSDVVGINSNYGDTATLSGICGTGVKSICKEFTGLDKLVTSAESPELTTKNSCLGAQGKATSIPAC